MKKTKKRVILILIIILLILTSNVKVMAEDELKYLEDNYQDIIKTYRQAANEFVEKKGYTYLEALTIIQEGVKDKNNTMLQGWLDGLKKNIKADTSMGTGRTFRTDLAEYIQREIDDLNDDKQESSGLRDDIKKDMEKECKEFKTQNKNANNYMDLLKDKCNEIEGYISSGKIPSGYTKEGLEYLKSLYENEIKNQEAKEKVENGEVGNGFDYVSGLSEKELREKIAKLDDEIDRLEEEKQKASGQEKEEIKQSIKELKEVRQQYYRDQGQIVEQEAIEKAGSSTGVLGESSASSSHDADEVISEADKFINAGKNQDSKISQNKLKNASNSLYNMLLIMGIVLAVIIGVFLGIKFMLSSAEDKAKVKEALIPYIAGCIVIFSGFTIWKLVISLIGAIG